MRVIIAGTREFVNYEFLKERIDNLRKDHGLYISQIVCGMARGVDLLGKRYAEENGIPVDEYPANWKPNGVFDRTAGYQRNLKMAENADCLIAFWDCKSPGTKHMLDIANAKRLEIFLYTI